MSRRLPRLALLALTTLVAPGAGDPLWTAAHAAQEKPTEEVRRGDRTTDVVTRAEVATPAGARGGAVLPPRFDDIFGDAIELQRTIDRSFALAGNLRRLSDDFARATQDTLGGLGRGGGSCPATVVRPYARAHRLGLEYLRVGRELARHHAQIQDLSQLGDGAGLTPDYRTRLQSVLTDYDGLLADYREMKAAFHGQLNDELRFAGCEPAALLAPGAASAGGASASQPAWDSSAGIEPEPPPRSALANAAGVTATAATRPTTPVLFYIDNSRCRRDHRLWVDGELMGKVKGGEREAFRATAGPHDLCLLGEGAGAGPRAADPLVTDGSRSATIGVPSAHASEGPTPPPGCGAPGTVRRSYLHEGWTIALRCE